MKLGTTTHPKFRRLQKLLKLPQYAAAGLLEMLWAMAAQYADDGNISRFSAQEIADYCDWEGNADELIATLITCKWLDKVGEELLIHDWNDHCPSYISDRVRKRKPFQEPPADSDQFQTVPDNSRSFQTIPENSPPSHSQAKPSPSQAMSSQTMPQPQLASSLADADAEKLIDGLLAGLDMEEVRQQATKLRKADKADLLTLQFVWESAVISEAVKPGFLSEIATGMRTNGIRKPKAYIDKALRDECEQRGFTLAKIRSRVPPCPVKESAS